MTETAVSTAVRTSAGAELYPGGDDRRTPGEDLVLREQRLPRARLAAADRSGLDTMTTDQLRERLRAGDAVVVDVRPPAEYAAGHIRGAVSVPISEPRARLQDIDSGARVVAYSRGSYCVYADEAVRILAEAGREAARLEDGFPEWAAARLPVARDA